MPKFFYDEETLREWATYSQDGEEEGEVNEAEVTAEVARLKRESDGRLSEYQSAQCALNQDKLSATSRLVLQELRDLKATQLWIGYDGGGDEGFAHLDAVKTTSGHFSMAQLCDKFQHGPLGDTPEAGRIFGWRDQNATRSEQACDAISWLLYELAFQLLGEGFGTGEFSLDGAFVADLETGTLTDIAPTTENN